jgi:hypothetical protein
MYILIYRHLKQMFRKGDKPGPFFWQLNTLSEIIYVFFLKWEKQWFFYENTQTTWLFI